MIKKKIKSRKTTEKIYIQGKPHKAISGFFSRTLQAGRDWHDTFKVLTGKISAARNTVSSRAIVQFRREFPKQKLEEFMTTKPAL